MRQFRAWPQALLLATAAIPFQPFWLDHEVARRGLAALLAALLLATAPLWLRKPPPRAWVWLAALLAWVGIRAFGTQNQGEALFRAGYWLALGVAFAWGATSRPERIASAVIPVGAIVAIYGLSQALGLDWPAGYTRPDQPVSSLGNRNVAAEVASLAAVAALWHAARGSRTAVVLAPIIIAYVIVNGSRSGMLATIVGAVVLAMSRPGGKVVRAPAEIGAPSDRARIRLLIAIAIGFVAGFGVGEITDTGTDTGTGTGTRAERVVEPSTIEVRLEMWKGCAAMIEQQPMIGVGTGQFRYEYPRFRRPEEIELSTFERQFPTVASNAHNDYLEVLVELGVPGLVLFLGFWLIVLLPSARSRRRVARLAPAAAFLIAMTVRSPLGNAPAALFAMLYAGALARPLFSARVRSRGWWLVCVPVAIALGWLGSGPLFGQSAVDDYISTARRATTGPDDGEALDRAVHWHPTESRFRSLRIQHRTGFQGELYDDDPTRLYNACQPDLVAINQLDPYNTTALMFVADVLLGVGLAEQAEQLYLRIRQLDFAHPDATLGLAVLWMRRGRVAEGIALLYQRPHQRLREQLATVLGDLDLKDAVAAAAPDRVALLEREHKFIYALDLLIATPEVRGTDTAIRQYGQFVRHDDVSLAIFNARRLLAVEGADAAAAFVPSEPGSVEPARARLLAPVLDALRAVPEWDTYLQDW